ncbi:MAG TPA: YfiR family protein [Arenimonas sp.]|nr:YfiR family protein [Arenimonas sp.]
MLAVATTAPAWSREATQAAQLKAAFVFNFSRYTEWPGHAFASPEAPLRLCLFSTDSEVGKALAALAGNPVRDRKIDVVKINSVDAVQDCHLLYVESGPDAVPMATIVARSTGVPLLTIGEGSTFPLQGGVIGLVTRDKRLGFEVNLEAAKRAELRLSSQLLALARIVKEG